MKTKLRLKIEQDIRNEVLKEQKEREEYNGWSNYETWNVILWIDNERGSQDYWQEKASDFLAVDGRHGAASGLADLLKEEFNEAMPDLGASMYSDLLSSALSSVDWYEIAKSLIETVQEYEKA